MSSPTVAIRVFFIGILTMLFQFLNVNGVAKSIDEIESAAIEFETHNFTHKFSDPSQEIRKGTGKIAFDPTGEGYDIIYKYNALPKYQKTGTFGYQPADYANGNLMYWRKIRNAGYSSGEFSRTLSTFEGLLISPQGTVVHETTNTLITIEHENERAHYLNEIWQCFGLVSNDKGFKPISNSYAENKSVFESSQTYKKKVTGYWKCTIDPDFSVVRKAEIFPVGSDHASSLLVTSGTVTHDGFSVAAEGQVRSLDGDKSGAYFKVKSVTFDSPVKFLSNLREELTTTTGPLVTIDVAP